MMRVEKRGERLYVYEVCRDGHRVVRTCVGTAAQFGAIAGADALKHRDEVTSRLGARDLLQLTREQDLSDEAELAHLDRLIADGVSGLGLHRPKRGPLRKKRHG